jgi:ribose transport system permease protein
MKKILGILLLLLAVAGATAAASDAFLTPENLGNLLRRSALFGLISVGAMFVIVTGGIDLSIGSLICLCGCLTPWLLVDQGWSPWLAMPALLGLAAVLGLGHGLLITRLRLQPFVVTLCGLLLYRGVARGLTQDRSLGFRGEHEGLRQLATGRIGVPGLTEFELPAPVLSLALVAALAALFLGRTIWGRYLYALGRNEEAARYSGIDTGRMVVLAYVICAALAGLAGMLFAFDVGSVQASSFGNFYELYAIAGAVLGGCALRGGEGTVAGVLLGATLMQVLRNATNLVGIPTQLEFAIIGAVILAGVTIDELVKRYAAARRLRLGR